jgi:hypothetical protein
MSPAELTQQKNEFPGQALECYYVIMDRNIPYALLSGEASAIRTGAVPGWLSTALRGAAAGNIAVVRHPLGFQCVPVLRFRDGGVCVHVWTPTTRPAPTTTSLVHCHSWDLHSVVIRGEVHNHLVEVLESGIPTHRVFDIRSDAGVDEIRATGELVRCGTETVGAHRAGDTYAMAPGTFHRTEVPGGAATTLVLARYRPGQRDRSLGPIGTPSHRVSRRHCDTAESARVARSVIRQLAT